MRNLVIITLIALLLTSCSGNREPERLWSRSEQELLSRFLEYHRQKDLTGMLGLFYQRDTPPFVVDSVRQRSQKNFAYTITSSQIEAIPADKLAKIMAGFDFNGKTLVPNLTPLRQISFTFAQTDQKEARRAAGGSIMFGKVDNVCYFILSKEKPAGPVATSPAPPPMHP